MLFTLYTPRAHPNTMHHSELREHSPSLRNNILHFPHRNRQMTLEPLSLTPEFISRAPDGIRTFWVVHRDRNVRFYPTRECQIFVVWSDDAAPVSVPDRVWLKNRKFLPSVAEGSFVGFCVTPIRFGAWQYSWYIIGGGIIQHDTYQQRTFAPAVSQRSASLHSVC